MGAKRIPTVAMAQEIISFGVKIGEGSYRKVYAKRYGKWAVKVNLFARRGFGGNTTEYNTYLDFKNKELPEGVKIPEMHLLPGNMLVVERIKGKHPGNWCEPDAHQTAECDDEYSYSTKCPGLDKCWVEKVKGVHIKDLHPYNVKVLRDGTIYIIDLGHGEGEW